LTIAYIDARVGRYIAGWMNRDGAKVAKRKELPTMFSRWEGIKAEPVEREGLPATYSRWKGVRAEMVERNLALQ
jgi:hypothetical protein